MLQTETKIEGGFQDPVLQSQAVFRSIMNAMAMPGIVEPLTPLVDPPAALSPSAAAIVKARRYPFGLINSSKGG